MASASTLPGVKHKVIGLVSGGKDSCFNLMHTVANGHELVALATLTPPAGTDELDSHMYQSVGTEFPPLIAQAMGLPHYSRVITGGAVEQGAEYGSRERGGEGSGREGDETEDLTALLLDVMAKHPDATAISSGAILSNYQRLRIEHVCQRLKLTSLAYLWQKEQLPLVGSMVSSGLEAVLVKVAGAGLTTNCLGKTLGQLFPLLTRLQAMYGAHPAGEGGEYETLTLDTPLFSHRINLTQSEVVITDPEPCLVAYLRIAKAELQAKEGWTQPTVSELREILGLDTDEEDKQGLDEQSCELFEELADAKVVAEDDSATEQPVTVPDKQVQFGRNGRWFSVSAQGEHRDGKSVGGELTDLFDAVKSRLSSEGLSLPLHATHITLLLSNMSDFPAANAAYIKYFGTSPPSRACVAVPLPKGERLRVDIVGFDDKSTDGKPIGGRSTLHVQGMSYWAPANIGPYSQAVAVNSRLHIAGQIPLQPPTLTFAPYPAPPASPYAHQAVLALQHVRRIVDVLRNPNSTGGGWTGWGESCVAWWARPDGCGAEGPGLAQRAWSLWTEQQGWKGTPAIFVRASELPRGALVEYQVNVHIGREDCDPPQSKDDDDDDDEDLSPTYASGDIAGAHWETCVAPPSRRGARVAIFLPHTGGIPSLTCQTEVSSVLGRAVGVRVYHRASVDPSSEPLVRHLEEKGLAWTAIPVLDVQDSQGRTYALALEIFAA